MPLILDAVERGGRLWGWGVSLSSSRFGKNFWLLIQVAQVVKNPFAKQETKV